MPYIDKMKNNFIQQKSQKGKFVMANLIFLTVPAEQITYI